MKIPTWEDVALGEGEMNPLERFIYEHEPEDLGEDFAKPHEFREDLQKLMDWLEEELRDRCDDPDCDFCKRCGE